MATGFLDPIPLRARNCSNPNLSHDEITVEEIQQKLNSPETFEDFKKLWWISISYLMEKETLITFENWKRCVADNPSVIEFLYNHRRDRIFPGL